jgi:hypothetical protein
MGALFSGILPGGVSGTPLGISASGSIDVADDHAPLEVSLPWLVARLVETLQPLIRRRTLLLEKT